MTFCWDKFTEEDFEEFKANLADYGESECACVGHLFADNFDVSIVYSCDAPKCITLSVRSYTDSESDPPLYYSLNEEIDFSDETYSRFVELVEQVLQENLDKIQT